MDDPGTLDEIRAFGVRNPQLFGWHLETTAMYSTDIGQNTVEELSPVTAGAHLGWNVREGSFRYERRVFLLNEAGGTIRVRVR